MAEQSVRIKGAKELDKKLFAFQVNMKKSKTALNQTGKYLAKTYQSNFKTEGLLVEKKRWDKLSPRTIAEKMALGYGAKKILERTGALRKSIRILILNKFKVTVGSKLDYYKQHQLGDKKKKLPQRRMVGLNKEITTGIMLILRKFFLKPFK